MRAHIAALPAQNVNDHWYWGETWRGWLLAAFFFVDAYVLGAYLRHACFGSQQP